MNSNTEDDIMDPVMQCTTLPSHSGGSLLQPPITILNRSYALSWKPYQGDSLNLPDHRYSIYTIKWETEGLDDGVAASFQRSRIHKPHAHTQAFKVNLQPSSSPCHSVPQLAQLPEINMLKRGQHKGIIIMENIYYHGEQLHIIIWLNASHNEKITVVILVRDRCPRGKGHVWGCDRLVIRANVIENQDENVGSPPSRIILFGDIPTVIPSIFVVAPETSTIAPIISSAAPVVETTLVASPTGLCGLVPYSDSDSDSPDEISSPEHISPLPAISPFLYTDSFEAPDSSDGPPSQDPYVATIAH
ncbi:hypothetical protein Tco_0903474 [Tanacetum coccineum]